MFGFVGIMSGFQAGFRCLGISSQLFGCPTYCNDWWGGARLLTSTVPTSVDAVLRVLGPRIKCGGAVVLSVDRIVDILVCQNKGPPT